MKRAKRVPCRNLPGRRSPDEMVVWIELHQALYSTHAVGKLYRRYGGCADATMLLEQGSRRPTIMGALEHSFLRGMMNNDSKLRISKSRQRQLRHIEVEISSSCRPGLTYEVLHLQLVTSSVGATDDQTAAMHSREARPERRLESDWLLGLKTCVWPSNLLQLCCSNTPVTV